MKIIMLSGESRCGKTTTLNKVYDFISPTDENIIRAKKQLGGKAEDFECIIRYIGKTVAFFTMGDYSLYLVEAFEKYNKLSCDFLICACNNRFKKPYQKVTRFSNLIINKKKSISQRDTDTANNFDKDCIINELDRQ
jgi:hypothetical protein